MRVAIYAHETAVHGERRVDREVAELKKHCGENGWEIVKMYRDGRRGIRVRVKNHPLPLWGIGPLGIRRRFKNSSVPRDLYNRINFSSMMYAAERRDFDILLFWSLDQLSWKGVASLRHIFQKLTTSRVHWLSYTDAGFDSRKNRKAILSILDALEKHEENRFQANARDGVRRSRHLARKAGTKVPFGAKPKITVEEFHRAQAWLSKQEDGNRRVVAKLCAKLGLSRATVYRLMKRAH